MITTTRYAPEIEILRGFETGLQIIFVGISLAVGLGISLFLTHPIPSRRRAGGIFSL